MPTDIDQDTQAKLAKVSTATLTTCLFKRGLRNVFIQGIHRINPKAGRMVGPAFTMRYIPAREDLDTLDVFQGTKHPQRRAVEDIPPGCVFVIDSRKDARAASAGDILITRMMVRGVAGVVTDGGFRDTPTIEGLDIPCYHAHAAAPTNLVHHHATDLNVPIGCGDVPVYPGDIIVGDDEGVVVIPRHLAAEVAEESTEMTAYEDFVSEQVQGGAGIFGLYPPSDESRAKFAEWRKANGR